MAEKITILYVDDEPINLQVFEINLMDEYKVLTAESGQEGLTILSQTNDISVVISDMRMPKMDGLAFIAKAYEINPRIPFLILTGFDITPEIKQAMQEGLVQKYLGKPFDLEEINAAIQEVV